MGLRPDSLGSYSCDLVGKPADMRKKFLAVRESLLYFAVEAANMEPSGAMQGAYSLGMDSAEERWRRLLMHKARSQVAPPARRWPAC